jgi:hypothetical protein
MFMHHVAGMIPGMFRILADTKRVHVRVRLRSKYILLVIERS